MTTDSKITKDSRDETLRDLIKLLNDALRASIIAQLCARGNTLEDAIEKYKNLNEEQIKSLITPSAGSGYLDFQWIAESILKVHAYISSINLQDFWEFVRAKQPTNNVYESHLNSALKPINNSISGIRKNLQDLYSEYPGNKVTGEALPLLRQVQESTDRIEGTIKASCIITSKA